MLKTALIAGMCALLLDGSIQYAPPQLPKPPEHSVVPVKDKHEKIDEVRLTHYCICQKCCGKTPEHPAYGITASGRTAEPYISVAVDPSVIPLGSTVWLVYEDGTTVECRADDTGGAIKGARIDLCVSSHSEALELGVDSVTVYWKEGDDVLHK